jgi:hypothetical protein
MYPLIHIAWVATAPDLNARIHAAVYPEFQFKDKITISNSHSSGFLGVQGKALVTCSLP